MNQSDPEPNILVIMADQMTAALTGVYGHPVVKTPHLDRLATDGIRFDSAYTPCPICAPARACFMTGKYISNNKCYDNGAPFSADEPTIPHYLNLAGYDTVLSGKMHLVGPDQLHGFSRRLTPEIYPADFSWTTSRENRGETFFQMHEVQDDWFHAQNYMAENIEIGKWSGPLSYDEEAQFRSIEYLRAMGQRRRADLAKGVMPRPFFLCSSYHHPHDPFWPPQDLWDLYEGATIELPKFPDHLQSSYSAMDRWLNTFHRVNKVNLRDPRNLYKLRRAYYALVTYIDNKVGEFMRVLKEAGLEDNTIVIFTSDHGEMLMEKGMIQKRSFYEWSSRIPLIIRFPDGWKRGTICKQPVSFLDLLPTVLDVAGVEERLPMDGKSIVPLMQNGGAESREAFSEMHTEGVYAVCIMLRKDRYKYIYIHGEQPQLFDLENDPEEWNNLAGRPEHRSVEKQLHDRILQTFDVQAIEKDLRDSLLRRQLLRKSMRIIGIDWDHSPTFDAGKNALEQYLVKRPM